MVGFASGGIGGGGGEGARCSLRNKKSMGLGNIEIVLSLVTAPFGPQSSCV
jgi:hypothetical protein